VLGVESVKEPHHKVRNLGKMLESKVRKLRKFGNPKFGKHSGFVPCFNLGRKKKYSEKYSGLVPRFNNLGRQKKIFGKMLTT